MGLHAYTIDVALESMGECFTCGVPIFAPQQFKRNCLDNKSKQFYCVNGHPQHYISETPLEKANKLLEEEKKRHDTTKRWLEGEQNAHRSTRGQVTKLKKRISAGVCPCCQRSFQNVQRHMKTKHPDFASTT